MSVGASGAARVHRSLGIGADHPDRAVRYILEVPAGSGDGPAGADAGHEMGDLAIGVGPDLRAGALVVAGRIGMGASECVKLMAGLEDKGSSFKTMD